MEKIEQNQKSQSEKEINDVNGFVEVRSDPIMIDDSEVYLWALYPFSKFGEDEEEEKIIFDLYLYNEFMEQHYYTRLFEILKRLPKGTYLNVYINSEGGSLTTLISFINVFEQCEAEITIDIDGFADSAAAILSLCGDNIITHPTSCLMFHNIQSAFRLQNSTGIRKNIESLHKIYDYILKTYCSKVLTKKEIKSIIDGGELYLTGEEISKRIKNLVNE